MKKELYSDQVKALAFLKDRTKGVVFQPTGTGKSLIIYRHLAQAFFQEGAQVCVLASHRLMLNGQHLRDLFVELEVKLGAVGYILVGSSPLVEKEFHAPSYNRRLKELGLSYGDLLSSATNESKILREVSRHQQAGRKVILISTYHSLAKLQSLEINTLYCDEAHLLASEAYDSCFKSNFEVLKFRRSFFFTATPKDGHEESKVVAFLMNNEEIFGERHGLSFKASVNKGYIVKPVLHLAIPSNYERDKEYGKTVVNNLQFIREIYQAHRKWLHKVSSQPALIEPKLLVRCSSVDMMWDLHAAALACEELTGIHILAGASREGEGKKHQFNTLGIESRGSFLEEMKAMSSTQPALILHYDILSEGINVSGITGVVFLNDTLPTKPKVIQNTGRATRKHFLDAERFWRREIQVGDGQWIKPHCAVILPIFDVNAEHTTQEISKMIRGLRDEFGYDPAFYVSEGSDIAKSKPEDEELADLNVKKRKNSATLIEKIRNEIEQLENQDRLVEFRKALDQCVTVDEALSLLNW
jgi:superfamily II DNA or RNA helicase